MTVSEIAPEIVSRSSQKWKMGFILIGAILVFVIFLVFAFSFFEPAQTPVDADSESSGEFPTFIFGILFFVMIIVVIIYFFTRKQKQQILSIDEAAGLLITRLNAIDPGKRLVFGNEFYAGIEFLDTYIIQLINQPNYNKTFIVSASKPLTIRGSFYSSWKEIWEELKNEEFLKKTYLEEVKNVKIKDALKGAGLTIEE